MKKGLIKIRRLVKSVPPAVFFVFLSDKAYKPLICQLIEYVACLINIELQFFSNKKFIDVLLSIKKVNKPGCICACNRHKNILEKLNLHTSTLPRGNKNLSKPLLPLFSLYKPIKTNPYFRTHVLGYKEKRVKST